MTNKYQSRYSGSEIEKILESVNAKISFDDIVDDYSGGVGHKVASAESVKKIKTWSDNFNNPEWVKELFSTIPDSELYTESDKDALEALKRGFLGTFQDTVQRSTNLDAKTLLGGETTLLLNRNGVQSFEYYDATTQKWFPCKWTKDAVGTPQVEVSNGNKVVYQFNRYAAQAFKLLVRSETVSDVIMFEIMGTVKGGSTYVTTSGYIGSSPQLASISRFYIDGDLVKLELNLAAGSTTTIYKLAEF